MEYEKASKQLEWQCKKFELIFNTTPPKFKIYYNCVYWVYLGYNVGSEQNKLRPAIVTRYLKNANLCTIIPITSKRRGDKFPYHIDLECMPCVALVEQMRVVDIRRISNPERVKGRTLSITPNDWKAIQAQIISLYSLKSLSIPPIRQTISSTSTSQLQTSSSPEEPVKPDEKLCNVDADKKSENISEKGLTKV